MGQELHIKEVQDESGTPVLHIGIEDDMIVIHSYSQSPSISVIVRLSPNTAIDVADHMKNLARISKIYKEDVASS